MARILILTAGLLGFLGVGLGAFGAHGLQATLEAHGRFDTFDTANRYHMIHILALLAVAWMYTRLPSQPLKWAGWLFIAGIVIFSGSLYILAVFNAGVMGAVAPIGGVSLMAGWASVALSAWREADPDNKRVKV